MTDKTEALPPLPEQLAATFIGYVEGLLGVCRVPSHVFEAFEQRADEFRAALSAAPSAQQGAQVTTHDKAAWASYVAGMIGAYLGWQLDDERNSAVASIIERRLWALSAAPSAQAEPVSKDCASPPVAQAEPQEPLTDEHISALYVSGWGAYCSRASFIAIFREAERVHGIGKQEGK